MRASSMASSAASQAARWASAASCARTPASGWGVVIGVLLRVVGPAHRVGGGSRPTPVLAGTPTSLTVVVMTSRAVHLSLAAAVAVAALVGPAASVAVAAPSTPEAAADSDLRD